MTSPNPKTSHTSGAAKPTPPPNFDTMNAMEMLMKAGFAQGQAGAIVGVVCGAQNELATKADLRKLETSLRGEMQNQFSQFYWRLHSILIRR